MVGRWALEERAWRASIKSIDASNGTVNLKDLHSSHQQVVGRGVLVKGGRHLCKAMAAACWSAPSRPAGGWPHHLGEAISGRAGFAEVNYRRPCSPLNILFRQDSAR